jgi:hypothetical protein
MTEFMVNMHSNPDAMHMMRNKMMMGNMMGDNGTDDDERQHDDKKFHMERWLIQK